MNTWTKLQHAAIGLTDLLRERYEGLVEKGQAVAGDVKPVEETTATVDAPAPKARMSREEKRQHVLDTLAGGKRVKLKEIAELAGKQTQLFRATLAELVDEGLVIKRKDRRYALKR